MSSAKPIQDNLQVSDSKLGLIGGLYLRSHIASAGSLFNGIRQTNTPIRHL